jgi:hypothetical protein
MEEAHFEVKEVRDDCCMWREDCPYPFRLGREIGRLLTLCAVELSAECALGSLMSLPSRQLSIREQLLVSNPLHTCGVHLADTKEPASIVVRPVCANRSMRSILVSSGIVFFSFCSPSRGPTSTMWTRSDAGIAVA